MIIEALACGRPVAACPLAKLREIPTDDVGALCADFDRALASGLFCDGRTCPNYGAKFGWNGETNQFLAGLDAIETPLPEDSLPILGDLLAESATLAYIAAVMAAPQGAALLFSDTRKGT